MSWNTSNTLELLGVIGTAFGAGVACYKRRRVTAASHWLLAKARGVWTQQPETDTQQSPESRELPFWNDPNVESGAATLGGRSKTWS